MGSAADPSSDERRPPPPSLLSPFIGSERGESFTYSRETKRFVDAAGEGVEDRVVRSALDEALEEAADEVAKLTTRLADGEMSLARWQQSMARHVKDAHLNAGALTKGGWDELTQRDFGQIGGRIREELEYLQGFAEDIEDGAQALDGSAIRRARMYPKKARKTHHKLHRREMQKIGYNQEKNVLGIAEHCSECIELTTRGDNGWVPNGTLTPIGDRICLSNCRCSVKYRRTETTDPDKFPSVRQ